MLGDSGTSFKTSPAIGRCLAEWIMHGRPPPPTSRRSGPRASPRASPGWTSTTTGASASRSRADGGPRQCPRRSGPSLRWCCWPPCSSPPRARLRPARTAVISTPLLRRGPRPRRRSAEGPSEAHQPRPADLHVRAGRGPGRLRERVERLPQAHREGDGQEDEVLRAAELRGADRGHALGPAAHRRRTRRGRSSTRSTSPAPCRSPSCRTPRGSAAITLWLIAAAKNDKIKTVADLKGKRVAHVSQTSNSGHQAPVLLLLEAWAWCPARTTRSPTRASTTRARWASSMATTTPPPWPTPSCERMAARSVLKASDYKVICDVARLPDRGLRARAQPGAEARREDQGGVRLLQVRGHQRGKEFKPRIGFMPLAYARDWESVLASSRPTA